jgi:anti-sigma factor RsiW
MNPCAKNKRRIAWMAAGVLDETDAETLRQHMAGCPACRRYWQSMCELSERLVNAGDPPTAEPTGSFHRTLVRKIRAQQQRTPLFDCVTIVQRLFRGRPLARFSAGVALALTVLLWVHLSRDAPRVRSGVHVVAVPDAAGPAAPPPTLASYRRAADISLERLDALLTREATRTSPAGETFTVSSLLRPSLEN